MNEKVGNFIEAVFPVREESRSNRLAFWLDRAIYFCIFLLAVAAPVSIAATNIAWLSGLALWILRFFVVRPRPRLFRSPLDFALLGFFGWCLFSCFFSYAPDLSFDRLRVLTLFPIAYLVSQNVFHPKTVRFLAAVLIFSCAGSVVWTFVQRIPGRGVQVYGVKPEGALGAAKFQDGDTLLRINGKRFRQPEDLIAALENGETIKLNAHRTDWHVDGELSRNKLADGASAAEKLGFERWKPNRTWRAEGFYSHYATYAEVLQLILSLAFGIFIALPDKRSKLGVLLLICLVGMSAALVLTATRGSQLGFVLSALAIVSVGANRKVLLALVAVFLPLALAAVVFVQQTRNVGFYDRSDNSTTWRETVWREGFELLTKSPRHLTVGVGIDSINRFRCDWGLFAGCTLQPGHFHSTPLQIAVECGLPALFLWLFVVFRYGKTLLDSIKNKSAEWLEKGILLGALGGLVGFFASGAVHFNLGDSEVAMTFYFIMGLSLIIRRNLRERKGADDASAPLTI